MTRPPLTVAWISQFPVEWLPDATDELRQLPRYHPASWQRVLLKELEKNTGVRLHILVLRKEIETNFTFERNGVVFHLIKVPRASPRAPSFFWVDTILIRRALEQVRPDIVHAWGTENGAALVASRLGYPYLVTIQGLLSWYAELTPLNLYHRLAARLERFSLPRAPLVTIESTFCLNYLRTKLSCRRAVQIEHAPDPVFHKIIRRPQTDPVRFILVGDLEHRKGGDILLRALDSLKSDLRFELIVLGKAHERTMKSIEGKISAELWSRVRFKTNLSPPQVAQELETATMTVFPTRADTSPNAVKEAVVAGVPVVASRIGGIPDYVFPGENGFLFKSEDIGGCIAAIRAACGHPLFGRGLVEPASLVKTRGYLSPELMGEQFWKAYQSVAEQHPQT